MKITIEIDTTYDRSCTVNKDDYRAAAALLLHLVGDLDSEETSAPKVPAAPSNATAPVIVSNAAQVVANVPPPPSTVAAATVFSPPPPPSTVAAATVFSPPPPPPVPVGTNEDERPIGSEPFVDPPSNVLPFQVPPPPPIANTAALTPPAPVASIAAGVSTVAYAAPSLASPGSSFGVDSAGMPYDARIHQKTGNKKKDGTWKLIKGIDTAVVTAVTAELASRKGAVAPVSLPYAPSDLNRGANTVPVPPVPPAVPAAATGVPAPPTPPPVPVPPVAAVGAVGSFRELIEKITAATKANQITPQKVSEVCQMHGAPNLMQLNSMPHLIADVSSSIDAVIAGLG